MPNERVRSFERQTLLIEELSLDAKVRSGLNGRIEAYAYIESKKYEVVLRDMEGGPPGRTTVLVREQRDGAMKDRVVACLDVPSKIVDAIRKQIL